MARSKQVSVVRGKPHAAFEAAGAGNVAWSKYWDTRNRKGEQQGIQTSTYTGAPVLDPTESIRRGFDWLRYNLRSVNLRLVSAATSCHAQRCARNLLVRLVCHHIHQPLKRNAQPPALRG